MLKVVSFRSAGIAVGTLGLAMLSIVLIKLTENRFNDSLIPIPDGFDNTSEYLWGWVWALVLCIIVIVLPLASRTRLALLALWIAKIAVTLGLMLIYEAVYGLDAWLYYFQVTTGIVFVDGAEYSGNVVMMDVIEFLLRFQPTSYHATKVSFAFIGLAGTFAFYRAAVIYLEREDLRILFFLGLFPSILFWSSILGKDPITFLGVGLYSIGMVDLLKNGRPRYLIFLIVGVALATWMRVWYFALMVAPMVTFLSSKKLRAMVPILVIFAIVFGSLFQSQISNFVEGYGFRSGTDLIQALEAHGAAFVLSGSESSASIGTPPDLSSFSSFMKHLPFGTFAMLFRPLPGEVLNPFGLLVGVENLIILYLLYKAAKSFSFEKIDSVLLWAMLYVLGWAAFHGLVILNFGSSVRFRLNMLPLLIAPLAYLGYWQTTAGVQKQKV